MVAPYNKFTFDTEFFEVVAGGGGAGASKSLNQTVEEARQQAYAEGQAQGMAGAQADVARVQQHAQNTLLALQEAIDARERGLTQQLLGLLRGTLVHVLGQAAKRYPDELLAHHLQALVPLAKVGEALVLRIHPQARGYHEKLALPQANILGLPMQIMADATLGPTDAVLEWQHGGLESKLAQQEALILELLQAAGAAPGPVPVVEPTLVESAGVAPVTASPMTGQPVEEGTGTGKFSETPPAEVAAADDALSAAKAASAARAAALLGDDELHDALKS